MQTARLVIRPMKKEDEISYINGISDKSLCAAYGFPADMDEISPGRFLTVSLTWKQHIH